MGEKDRDRTQTQDDKGSGQERTKDRGYDRKDSGRFSEGERTRDVSVADTHDSPGDLPGGGEPPKK